MNAVGIFVIFAVGASSRQLSESEEDRVKQYKYSNHTEIYTLTNETARGGEFLSLVWYIIIMFLRLSISCKASY